VSVVNPADPFGLIGQVLDGQFRVDKFIGEGGFSIVYRGHHTGLNEPIAIKCLKLPPALGSALVESFLRRFRDESRIHYRLSQGSLAIARSIASGTTMSASTSALVPYMVLEWLDGRSMAQDFDVRRQQGATGRSMDEVVKLLDPAAQGLAFAHSQGVVHRDMNPGNLFLAERHGAVTTKVLDFGVAKIVSDHALELGPRAPTLGQIRIFAPAYGSPEQFDDSVGKVGPASDVYSFSLILLEALRDLPVREGEHLGEFAMMALEPKGRPTPRSLGVPVGDAVEDVIKRAGALNPAERPPDMGQFWGGLKHAIRADAESGKAPHADHVPSRPVSTWKPHTPAAGAAPPVSANMPAPIVEVTRPGSTAPPRPDPGQSQLHRGTVRMPTPAPPAGSGAAALKATPLTSTLVMEPRTTPSPEGTRPGLTSTLAMASPYARSQSVPQFSPPQISPPQKPPVATMMMDSGGQFAAARAMANAAATAAASGTAPTVASSEMEAAFAAARAVAETGQANVLPPPPPPPPVNVPLPLLRSEVPTVVPPKPKSPVMLIVILAAALGIVLAFAIVGYRSRRAETPVPPPAPAPSAVATMTAPPPVTSAVPAEPSSVAPAVTASGPFTTATAATVVPTETPPSEQPSPRHAQSAPPADAPTPTPRPVSIPTPIPMPQPAAPTPIAAPTPLAPQGFDPAAARAALDVMNGVLASCRSPGGKTGDGKISVTFNPDGHADRATVDEPPFTGTQEGACVASRFKQAKIAPFQGAAGSVVYTFHIPN
jgi:serine/threonine protein kinase